MHEMIFLKSMTPSGTNHYSFNTRVSVSRQQPASKISSAASAEGSDIKCDNGKGCVCVCVGGGVLLTRKS